MSSFCFLETSRTIINTTHIYRPIGKRDSNTTAWHKANANYENVMSDNVEKIAIKIFL